MHLRSAKHLRLLDEIQRRHGLASRNETLLKVIEAVAGQDLVEENDRSKKARDVERRAEVNARRQAGSGGRRPGRRVSLKKRAEKEARRRAPEQAPLTPPNFDAPQGSTPLGPPNFDAPQSPTLAPTPAPSNAAPRLEAVGVTLRPFHPRRNEKPSIPGKKPARPPRAAEHEATPASVLSERDLERLALKNQPAGTPGNQEQ